MLEIVSAPNPVLSQKAKPIAKIDKGILSLIEEMKKSLESAADPVGVGLAAPQVGRALKIFIAKPSLKAKPSVFINPRIISQKKKLSKAASNAGEPESAGRRTRKLEGCLSLPNIWGEVLRYNEANVEFEDETGKKHNKKFKGFLATIIQHEIDHLNGILFTKRVLEQNGTLYKSEKDEKGQDVFEEIKI
ncbi:MAG: peptide deformylase [Patescibacteria group bacterium]